MNHTIAELQAFFCKGMAETWAKGTPGLPAPGRPGYELHGFQEGGLSLVDIFCGNHQTGRFSGTTEIYSGGDQRQKMGEPVWIMHYDGVTPEPALGVLRAALLANYSRGVFLGGRGPAQFGDPSWTEFLYENDRVEGSFACFSGQERILRHGPRQMYPCWTRYFGMLLI